MTHSIDASSVAACDLGKTSCRLRLGDETVVVPGAPGLASPAGVEAAVHAIELAASQLSGFGRASILSVGAAGALSATDAARTLAERLATTFSRSSAVTSDVVTAHAGAFSGCGGTLLIAGTGAVAISLDERGTLTRVDGYGPWLGDEGSGQWIGRHGLRAVLRAADGTSSATSLTEVANERYGTIESLPRVIGEAESPARELARFAPDVLHAAESGDETASQIIARAIEALATTALSARVSPVAFAGGLTEAPFFHRLLTGAVEAGGGHVAAAEGSAIDGAFLIALDPALPHERFVHRVA